MSPSPGANQETVNTWSCEFGIDGARVRANREEAYQLFARACLRRVSKWLSSPGARWTAVLP